MKGERGVITLFVSLTLLGAPEEVDRSTVEDGRRIDFFEKKIRPVLVEHCYSCHSGESKSLKGGLRLDSRAHLQRGGDSGKVIDFAQPNESLLLTALRYEDFEMPPDGKLPDDVIADFAKWIELGAPDPRDGNEETLRSPVVAKIDVEAVRAFWAFRTLASSQKSIDTFVAERRADNSTGESLVANPRADNPTLLRRIYFDLIGLPPEPKEVTAFLSDALPNAIERLVDRLLASPQFGERWGRYWLDLAQYADSLDIERVFPNRGAWRYRDYVIRSFNQDKPFDRFVVEQIAGDLLPYASDTERANNIVATQFITLGPMNLVNQFKAQLRMDIVDNQVDKIGRAFLGLTLGCARCHDHKFDPIPQDDYYALAGIVQNVQVLDGFKGVSGVFSDWLRTPIPELPEERDDRHRRTKLHRERAADIEAKIAAKKEEIAQVEAANDKKSTEEAKPSKDEILKKLKGELADSEKHLRDLVKANPPRPPEVLAATEPAQPTNARVTIRGNAVNLGEEVARGVPRVLKSVDMIPESASGRLELARSLVHKGNPIVARVFVNRVWHHLFGVGIVRTVDNFGARGEEPSHPELLDALAQRFVASGWQIKALIREIVLSRTYQLSSAPNASVYAVDPQNRFLWRHSPRRLDAESIRDALLKVSGTLSSLVGGPTLPPAQWNTQEVAQFDQIDNRRITRDDVRQGRSVYLPVSRAAWRFDAGDPLRQFDFPSPNDVVGARQSSIVPTQSLYLMNSPFVSGLAKKFAERVLADEGATEEQRVNNMYLAVYGRPVRPSELREAHQFLVASKEESRGESGENSKADEDLRSSTMTRLCHALLISTEFLMHD